MGPGEVLQPVIPAMQEADEGGLWSEVKVRPYLKNKLKQKDSSDRASLKP
jgi:hypothetical protein